jgi:hypothetical protein
VFKMMHLEMLLYHDRARGIDWQWLSLDSASVNTRAGRSPTLPTHPRLLLLDIGPQADRGRALKGVKRE